MNLTDKHIAYLSYVAQCQPAMQAVARHLGMRLSTVSMMRNRLRDEGLIYDWQDYNERMQITDEGSGKAESRREAMMAVEGRWRLSHPSPEE